MKSVKRQQKRQQFDLFQKARRSEVSNENCTINEASPKEIKHTRPAGTCVIVGDSIITRIAEKRLSKNRLVKVHDFRGVTLADIKHHMTVGCLYLDYPLSRILLYLEQNVRSLEIYPPQSERDLK